MLNLLGRGPPFDDLFEVVEVLVHHPEVGHQPGAHLAQPPARRIRQTVDVPNLLVSALLPMDIFM